MDVKLPIHEVIEQSDFLPLAGERNWGITKYLGDRPDYSGEGCLIAVFDEGISNHIQLKDKVVYSRSFTGDGLISETGHGTHVAGTIAADDPAMGIAHKAKLANYRVLSKNGGSFEGLVAACKDFIDLKNQSSYDYYIVNMSLGAPVPNTAFHEAIKEMIANDIIVICAAGNDGVNDVDWPAAHEETIAVAAIDENEKVASFSSKGKEVTVAAAGTDIWSLMGTTRFARMSGTSMATPFVTGVVARYLSSLKTVQPQNMPFKLPTMGITLMT